MQGKEKTNDYSFRIAERFNKEYFNREISDKECNGFDVSQMFNKFKFENNIYVRIRVAQSFQLEILCQILETSFWWITTTHLWYLVNWTTLNSRYIFTAIKNQCIVSSNISKRDATAIKMRDTNFIYIHYFGYISSIVCFRCC